MNAELQIVRSSLCSSTAAAPSNGTKISIVRGILLTFRLARLPHRQIDVIGRYREHAEQIDKCIVLNITSLDSAQAFAAAFEPKPGTINDSVDNPPIDTAEQHEL